MSTPVTPHSPAGAPAPEQNPVPETREGWFVLHDCYTVDWTAWRRLSPAARAAATDSLSRWLQQARGGQRGDSGAYLVAGQKAELMFLHYRAKVDDLIQVRRELQEAVGADLLRPAHAFLSIIEVSLYEVQAHAARAAREAGHPPGSEAWQKTYDTELERQSNLLEARLYRSIPGKAYCCYYPMNKKRGEKDNWYAMSLDERRALMRGHGRTGHRYAGEVTQVISSAVGLDDWEWAVDLFADRPLVFKKLVYDMRFDAVSARFAEFGPFYVGQAVSEEQLAVWFAGSFRRGEADASDHSTPSSDGVTLTLPEEG